MPHVSIHSCCDTNWKPASPLSNDPSSHSVIAPVTTAVISATSLIRSGWRFPTTVTSHAPATGRRTRAVRIGNDDGSIR